MSRPYRVILPQPQPVSRDVSRSAAATVVSDDCVQTQIVLESILPEAAMKEVLREVALKNGWKQADCGKNELHKDADGVEVTIDLDNLVVTAKIRKSAKVESKAEARVVELPDAIGDKVLETMKKLDAKVSAETQEKAEEKKAELDKAVLDKLTSTESSRKKDLNKLLQDVYAEAVKKKAATLGNVTSVQESTDQDGTYELRIKITE